MPYQTICGNIAAAQAVDCANLPQNGTADRVILINRGDVDFSATTTDANGSVTSLALKATKTGFQIDGMNQSIVPKHSLVIQGNIPRYQHEIGYTCFKVDQATRAELEKMAMGSLVAVTETKDQVYEVHGFDVGLQAVEITREPNNGETNGLFQVILRTPENVPQEKKLPRVYLNTDYATTTTELEALL